MPRFDTPINTNDQSLDRVLAAGLPVVLVLWRGEMDRSLEEALRQVAKTEAGSLLVARVDVDENPQTAQRAHGPYPALIGYRDGSEVTRAAAVDARSFREHVAFLLGRGPRPATRPQPEAAPRTARPSPDGHAPTGPVVVSDATFQQEVVHSQLPVLVDLWAPWCGPCRMIAPVVEKLAREYAGKLKVAKLNVDDNPRTAQAFDVRGIPTLLIFSGGKVVDRIVGAAPEPMLRGKVDAALRQAQSG